MSTATSAMPRSPSRPGHQLCAAEASTLRPRFATTVTPSPSLPRPAGRGPWTLSAAPRPLPGGPVRSRPMSVRLLGDLPPVPDRTVVINAGTDLVATRALLSAVEHAGPE